MTQCDPALQNLGYAHDDVVSFPTPLSNGLKRVNFALFSMRHTFRKILVVLLEKKNMRIKRTTVYILIIEYGAITCLRNRMRSSMLYLKMH